MAEQKNEYNYYPITMDSSTKEGTAEEPQTNTPNVSDTEPVKQSGGSAKITENSIQSLNYVKDQSGWFLSAAGILRAVGVVLSGTITAVAGAIGGWIISATKISSTNDKIVLDSDNETIDVGDIEIDGVNSRLRSANYVAGKAGAGFNIEPNFAEFGDIRARGTIRTAVFQKDVISSVGGSFAVIDSDALAVDMTALDSSTLQIAGNTSFAVGDILRIKDGTDDEWLEVTNIGSAPTYTVTRDKAGVYASNTNPAWKKGASVVNYRQSGDGLLYMTASDTNAPYLEVQTHAGSPWSSIAQELRIGNLNGIGNFIADVYGMFIGNISSGNYLQYDSTSGDLIVNDSNLSNQSIFGDGSDGDVDINSGSFSSGPITSNVLTRDAYFNNLTLSGGNLDTGGYRCFVKETTTVNASYKLSRDGGDGSDGFELTGGAGSTALASGTLFGGYAGYVGENGGIGGTEAADPNGQPGGTSSNTGDNSTKGITENNGVAGVSGGAGGDSDDPAHGPGGAGGGATAGTNSGTIFNTPHNSTHCVRMFDDLPTLSQFQSTAGSGGAGGGGGGAAGNAFSGSGPNGGYGGGAGGGGATGGILGLYSRVIVNNGAISADGGDGGDGADGGNAQAGVPFIQYDGGGGGGGAGGAGGNGGVVMLVYSKLTNSGTISVSGGTGGTGGTGGSPSGLTAESGVNGTDGNDANDGVIIQLKI